MKLRVFGSSAPDALISGAPSRQSREAQRRRLTARVHSEVSGLRVACGVEDAVQVPAVCRKLLVDSRLSYLSLMLRCVWLGKVESDSANER